MRQHKLDLTATFIEIKSFNPKLKQSETAKELGCSSSTLKRYRNVINMISTYRNHSNINKGKRNISIIKNEPKRTQMSSYDSVVRKTVEPIQPVKTKNKLKDGANFEISENSSDEIVHNNYL